VLTHRQERGNSRFHHLSDTTLTRLAANFRGHVVQHLPLCLSRDATARSFEFIAVLCAIVFCNSVLAVFVGRCSVVMRVCVCDCHVLIMCSRLKRHPRSVDSRHSFAICNCSKVAHKEHSAFSLTFRLYAISASHNIHQRPVLSRLSSLISKQTYPTRNHNYC
jgi:hypothetical protein